MIKSTPKRTRYKCIGYPITTKPFLSTPINKTPTNVPIKDPDPPVKSVPPRITAVRASNSILSPKVGSKALYRLKFTQPANMAKVDVSIKVMHFTRSVFTPIALAASFFPPAALR